MCINELSNHSRNVMKKLRHERFLHRTAKAKVAHLEVTRPTLKESARLCANSHNMQKNCTNIIATHRSRVFGGRPTLWNFLQDVAVNLNQSDRGKRFMENIKSFALAMKMYGNKKLCDLFDLKLYRAQFSHCAEGH